LVEGPLAPSRQKMDWAYSTAPGPAHGAYYSTVMNSLARAACCGAKVIDTLNKNQLRG